jgi:hypothetical protein
MIWLRQSTSVTLKFGPFLDDSTGKDAETGLTIQKANVRLSKNGGDMGAAHSNQGANDVGAAHDEIGYYDIALDDTDTNTLGKLKVMAHISGALPVWESFLVMPPNVYDSLVSGSDLLDANAAQVAGQTASAAAGVTFPSSIGTSTYAGADTSGTTTLLARILGTLDTGTHKPQSGDAYARIGAAGASLTALGDTRLANLDATVSSRLAPTVAARTLDVTATGTAGIDWGNIENPLTAVTLSNSRVGYITDVDRVAALTDDAISASTITNGAFTEAKFATDAISAAAVSAAAVTKITTGIPAAVWSYATRTLSSFGTLLADIWAYAQRTLTQTAAQVAAVLSGADITATIAATLTVTLTGLSISTTRTKILLTAKRRTEQADSTALLQVLVSNPAASGVDGLLYINGVPASATQRTQATLVVDQPGGTITLTVADDLMALLSRTRVAYDVKQILADGTSSILTAGDFATDHTPTETV